MPRKRINVVGAPVREIIDAAEEIIGSKVSDREAVEALNAALTPEEPQPPTFWGRGALLNVRTTGGDYIVTLYPEEYDARSPERAMRFANPALCQNFVSAWYSRQSHDPRAW